MPSLSNISKETLEEQMGHQIMNFGQQPLFLKGYIEQEFCYCRVISSLLAFNGTKINIGRIK